MPYVNLDDGFYDHPTFADIADELVGVWVKGLAYCNRHLTDGFFPRSVTRSFCVTTDPSTVIQRMVEAGLWVDLGDRIQHVGYLDHNDSKKDVLARRKSAKERKSKWKSTRDGAAFGTRSAQRSAQRSEHDLGTLPTPHLTTPHQDPPKAPNSESVRETVRRAYGEGIRTIVPGPPFMVTDSEADVVVGVVRDDPKWAGLRGEQLAMVIRRSAAAYATDRKHDSKFERGLSPTKWVEWLRTGAGAPLSATRPIENAHERATRQAQLAGLPKAGGA